MSAQSCRKWAVWLGCWCSKKCQVVSGLRWQCGQRVLSFVDVVWLAPLRGSQSCKNNLWMRVRSASDSLCMASFIGCQLMSVMACCSGCTWLSGMFGSWGSLLHAAVYMAGHIQWWFHGPLFVGMTMVDVGCLPI